MKPEFKNLSDKKFNSLINEMAHRKEAAFESFYATYGRFVYSVAVSITKSSCLSDEIVDDVLFKIWQIAPTLKKIKNPLGWIYIVTANCAKDRIKTEKSFSEIYDISQDDKNIEELIIKESFLSYISTLNEEEQQIMILYFIQRLTFKLIAKEVKKPISSVTSTYYRAIEKLKNTIKKF